MKRLALYILYPDCILLTDSEEWIQGLLLNRPDLTRGKLAKSRETRNKGALQAWPNLLELIVVNPLPNLLSSYFNFPADHELNDSTNATIFEDEGCQVERGTSLDLLSR